MASNGDIGKSEASKEKDYSVDPFTTAFFLLSQELDMLRELNQELPKLVKKSFLTQLEKIVKKLKDDKKIGQDFETLNATIISTMLDLRNKKPIEKKNIKLDVDPKATNLFFNALMASYNSRKYVEFIRTMSLSYLICEMESFIRNILETALG